MRKGITKYRLIQAQLDNLGVLTSVLKTGRKEYSLIVNGEIVKLYRKRDTCNQHLIKILKKEQKTLPIGLYGCYCHPFKNWEEHDKFYTQRLTPGQKVKIRCSGKEGELIKKTGSGFWEIKTGELARDLISEHTQNLIKI